MKKLEKGIAKEMDYKVEEIELLENRQKKVGCVFDTPDGKMQVCTDEEANELVKEYILDSVWAFKASFLQAHSEALNELVTSDLKDIQAKLCEDANELIKASIDDLDEFVQDAIDSDGRGHFLNHYDSWEYEFIVGDDKEIMFGYWI